MIQAKGILMRQPLFTSCFNLYEQNDGSGFKLKPEKRKAPETFSH